MVQLKKKLTVVVSNFNDEEFLNESLTAICKQTFQGMEIIFIDDASTDNSVEKARDILSCTPSHKVIVNKTNRGVIKNYNDAINSIDSEYVYFASSNDCIVDGFFEKFIKIIDKDKSVALVSGLSMLMDEKGNLLGPSKSAVPSVKQLSLSKNEVLSVLIKKGNWIIGASTIYRLDLLKNIGGFREKLLGATDSCAALCLGMRHGVIFDPTVVSVWRLSENGFATSSLRKWSTVASIVDEGIEYFSEKQINNEFIKSWENEILFWHFKSSVFERKQFSCFKNIAMRKGINSSFSIIFSVPFPMLFYVIFGLLIIAPKKIYQRISIEIDWIKLRFLGKY